MHRVLIVLDGSVDDDTIVRRCGKAALRALGVVGAYALAICHVLPRGCDGFAEGLAAQRRMTDALRRALGDAAEAIAVLVAADRDGERIADCARAWGATVVVPAVTEASAADPS